MKKILFVLIATFIGLTSFAAGSIVKPSIKQPMITAPTVKENKVIIVPAGAKVVQTQKDGCICVEVIYSDGSGFEVCCCNCTITIIF